MSMNTSTFNMCSLFDLREHLAYNFSTATLGINKIA